MEHLMDLLQNYEFEAISCTQTSIPHVTFGGDDLKCSYSSKERNPISKFVAYNHLSSSVQALVTNLVGVEILKTT